MPYLNTQDQQRLVWARSFALASAYLDQLARSNGLGAEMMTTVRTTLTNAERRAGSERKTALTQIASQLNNAAAASRDADKVHTLATTVSELANAQR